MANQLYAGFVLTDAGVAISGATVDLLDRNTTTPVRATTTTDANGYFAISHATEGRFDVRITNGSSVRWRKYDTSQQMTALEVQTLRVRNPAFTFDYDIVPAAIAADRQLNLPLITGTDTLSSLGLAQTYSAIKTFSAIPVMSGGAVGFPGTQVASAVANDLDDYEEGTFTPALTFGGAAVDMTFTSQTGHYTKIGRVVTFRLQIVLSAKGSSTGAAVVTGLPFVAGEISAASIGYTSAITFADFLRVPVSAATIPLGEVTNAGVSSTLTDADFANNSDLYVAGTYHV